MIRRGHTIKKMISCHSQRSFAAHAQHTMHDLKNIGTWPTLNEMTQKLQDPQSLMWWVCVHVYTDQTNQTIDICTHCDQLGNIMTFFQVNFESSRGQRILMTHTLGMTKTLAVFRDPTWRIYPQLTLRACLFIQKRSRGESCTFLGTLSRKVFLKREMNIVLAFERFMLDNLFK